MGNFHVSKYSIHLRHHVQDESYVEIKDSKTFTIFGNNAMSKPGPKSGSEKRDFLELKDGPVKERSLEV